MRQIVILLGVLMSGAACVHTSDVDREQKEMQRIEYLETVFIPASEACARAGGFMILEGFADPWTPGGRLSYSDMRLAIARGCGGT